MYFVTAFRKLQQTLLNSAEISENHSNYTQQLGETLGFNNHLIQELLEYNEYKQILNNMEVPEYH